MFRNYRGFGILSDADSNVILRDEINVTMITLIGDKLTSVEVTH